MYHKLVSLAVVAGSSEHSTGRQVLASKSTGHVAVLSGSKQFR